MKLDGILNDDRVRTLQASPNAYVSTKSSKDVNVSQMQKVVFPEPYENASHYYNRSQFTNPLPEPNPQSQAPQQHNNMMFDFKSLLPMLMSGKMDMLKPLLSIFGGNAGGGMDFAKIFELFKPKTKPKNNEKKDEDNSSKFDDMIIIED